MTKQTEKFTLDDSFVNKYAGMKAPFGFNGAGEVVYFRTYSRMKEDGSNEQWHDTVKRVVEGAYRMQQRHVQKEFTGWNEHQAQKSAQEMYDRMWNLKFTPPGRGLWAMGSPITEEKSLYAALNNCAFVSTENIKHEGKKPFTFLMDASMLGVGVGFDTRGAGDLIVQSPDHERKEFYDIPDTREGWIKSLGILLDSYFLGNPQVEFGYDKIRPEGTLIKTFGGKASGPGPLIELHKDLSSLLDGRRDKPLMERDIVDIQNMIGRAVVSGNVRRSAEIAFGDPNSEEFLDLKNYEVNPERAGWGWASNNSVFGELGMDYEHLAERIRKNGEPGIAWLENMRDYGRMKDPANFKDKKVMGGNPCLEQSLESYELCCLVENYLPNHKNLDDFLRTLKFSYLYAKTVTLGETPWEETNAVMKRNRRIGSSVTGVAQFVNEHGLGTLKEWLDKGYDKIQEWDEVYSDWLAIPRSIKTTSVKPSGSVSLLAGVTPGIHFPHSEYAIRRITLANNSPLVEPIREAGYNLVESPLDNHSLLAEFPVKESEGIRTKTQVSMWEQLGIAATLQKYWADNQVSATITFDPETEGPQIPHALSHFEDKLKGISFLPNEDHGYELPPYEEITKEAYEERVKNLKPLDFSDIGGERASPDKFCDGDSCTVPIPSEEKKEE